MRISPSSVPRTNTALKKQCPTLAASPAPPRQHEMTGGRRGVFLLAPVASARQRDTATYAYYGRLRSIDIRPGLYR